jgi:hypothetical protein
MIPATRHRRTRLRMMLAQQAAAATPATIGKLAIWAIDAFPLREPRSGAQYSILVSVRRY